MKVRKASEIAADLERKAAYKRTKLPRPVRRRFLASGVQLVCAAPGCGATTKLCIDHIKPKCLGGTDNLSNLQILCRHHNSIKASKPDFLAREFFYKRPQPLTAAEQDFLAKGNDMGVV